MALAELLTDASATLAEFNRNQLAPAILKAAKNFNEFNSQHMSPALTEAGKHLAAFGVNHLTPALQQVGAGAREFGNQHAAPALTEVGKRLDGFGKSELGMALGEVGKSLEQASRIVMGPKLDEVVLPALNQTAEWVSSNPGWTALFTLGVMAPDVFTGPLYWVLGLGANGPIAGGVVATVQSGATGGYGAAVISNVVRASSAISGIGIALLGSKPEVKQETEGKFKQHSIDKKCGKKD